MCPWHPISCFVDIWPDNWAASPFVGARTFQTSLQIRRAKAGRNPRACLHVRIHHEKGQSMTPGTVKFYNDQKGFGFIAPDNGEKDVFVHATALERAGIGILREGQKVRFDTETDRRSGKLAVGSLEIA
jgi:CspA family cold shock protein